VRPQTSPPPRLTWLAVCFVTAFSAFLASVGADAHWLAALGGEIARLGEIPVGVPYATASSAGWQNVPVVGELIFHGFEAALGDRGLVLAQTLAVAGSLGALALDLRRGGAADSPSALVLLLAAAASASALLVVRAQLFSLLLFPVLILLVRSEARAPSRRVWLLPALLALWSNLHGGALLGLAVAGAYLALDRMRREPAAACAVLVASAAALLATPALIGTVDYYRGVLGSEAALRGEGMWAPLSPSNPFAAVFLAAGVPLILAALGSRLALWELVALAGLAAASAQSGRNGVWLVLFAAAPAARWLTGSRDWRLSPSPRPAAALAVLLAALSVLALSRAPTAAVAGAELRRQAAVAAAGAPILADDANAEALALDGQRVWIANPLDAFPRREQRLYLDWLDGRAPAQAVLPEAQAVVVSLGSRPQRRLARNPEFREAGRDARAVLYVSR